MGLAERGGQLNLLQREIEQKKSQLEQISDKLAREKVRLRLRMRVTRVSSFGVGSN